MSVSVQLPDEALELIARRAAEIVLASMPAPEVGPRYLSVEQAAEYIAGSRQRVYDLLSSGRLTRLKDGRRVLVERAELDRYLAGQPTGRLAVRRRGVATGLPPSARSRTGSRNAA